jgi:hypothetical protein
MRLAFSLASCCLVAALAGCGEGQNTSQKIAIKTTAQILRQAQPSLQMESDYELARAAIPAALKTVEGFWITAPHNENLVAVLTEGYCQYGTAFVEDDWEVAKFAKDLEAIEYHNTRASHIFTRCLNYALQDLGPNWQKNLFGQPEVVAKLIKETPADKRFSLLFAGLALGSLINHNLTRVEMMSYLGTVEQILARVLEIDAKHPQKNQQYAAMPYIALGMIYTARGKAMGGEPEKGKAAFEKALELTDKKFLLARTLLAYRVGLATNDEKFFHEQLKIVLETAPSVWPEQRLANEVAQRKARRYLKHEKELFQ